MTNCSCVNAFPGSLPSSGGGGAQVFRRYTGVGANPTPESVTVQLVSTYAGSSVGPEQEERGEGRVWQQAACGGEGGPSLTRWVA